MGQSLSVALAGAIFTGLGGATAGAILVAGKGGANTPELQATFAHSFQVTFIVCACIAAIGIFTSLTRGKEERSVKRQR
jgi:fucose permease